MDMWDVVTPSTSLLDGGSRSLPRSRFVWGSRPFGWDEKPTESDEDAQPCTDTQRSGRTDGLQNRTTTKAANEDGGDSDDLVIARRYATWDEQLWVRHEFAPDRRQHDFEMGDGRSRLSSGHIH